MSFLANCDALIIDLRENGGGYSSTFSAAEGLAFALKNRGRAKIIGERTRGGANPVEHYRFSEEGITVRIPTAQARDPKTGATWEGRGVEPNIEVPAFGQGLVVANIDALRHLLASEPDSSRRYVQQWALEDYQSQLNPIVIDSRRLSEYVGEYGAVKVTCQCGSLYYHRPDRGKQLLAPVRGDDDFKIDDEEGCSEYRIRFIRNTSVRIAACCVHDWDGGGYDVMTKGGVVEHSGVQKNRLRQPGAIVPLQNHPVGPAGDISWSSEHD